MSAPAAAASSSSAVAAPIPPWPQIEREAKAFAEANPRFEVETDDRRAEIARQAGLHPVHTKSAFHAYVVGKYPMFNQAGQHGLAFQCSDLIARMRSEVQNAQEKLRREYGSEDDYELDASMTHAFRPLFNLVSDDPEAFAYVIGADRLSIAELSLMIARWEQTLGWYAGYEMKRTHEMLAEARERLALRTNPRAAIAASGAGTFVAMRTGRDVAQHVAGYIHRSFGPFPPQLPLRIDPNLVELMRVRRELAMALQAKPEQLLVHAAAAKRRLDGLVESVEKRHHP